MSSVNPKFPMHLWDQLIFQATLTLNMLRPSRFNPKLSAHTAPWRAPLISQPRLFHLLERTFSSMKNMCNAIHGLHMENKGGTLHHQWNTTAVIVPMSSLLNANESLTWYIFYHINSIPVVTPLEEATHAAKNLLIPSLTHLLTLLSLLLVMTQSWH